MADLRLWEWLLLLALTAGAVLVHGYHGGAEDAEIYLPGVLKRLDPGLFPWNTRFFDSHAGMSLFSRLIAESVRLSHLPAEIVLLLWHVVTIFGLLLACFRIARLCFGEKHAAWCGVALVASLLTMPVAGTALYIMDQYRHVAIVFHRGFHAGARLRIGKALGAGVLWIAFTAAVHPLMALFLLALVAALLLPKVVWSWEPTVVRVAAPGHVSTGLSGVSRSARVASLFFPHQLVMV